MSDPENPSLQKPSPNHIELPEYCGELYEQLLDALAATDPVEPETGIRRITWTGSAGEQLTLTDEFNDPQGGFADITYSQGAVTVINTSSGVRSHIMPKEVRHHITDRWAKISLSDLTTGLTDTIIVVSRKNEYPQVVNYEDIRQKAPDLVEAFAMTAPSTTEHAIGQVALNQPPENT